jgi:ElaB/YqjD/DUF883 family membrane-anchored ribosome-binding protein
MPGKKAAQQESDRYIGVGIAIGAGIGLTIGALTGGWAIPIGMAVGSGIGIAIGAALDTRRRREAN